MITKAERAELRSLIRQRFKLLRAEVGQRQTELLAELEQHITERYAGEDKAWNDAAFLIQEAVREANRKANDVMRGLLGDKWPEHHDTEIVGTYSHRLTRPTQERSTLRYEGGKRIEAKVKAALLKLDQQEAELLTRLAMGVLESEEARGFLSEIPTVSALVPTVRLLELEQSWRGDTA